MIFKDLKKGYVLFFKREIATFQIWKNPYTFTCSFYSEMVTPEEFPSLPLVTYLILQLSGISSKVL